MMQTVINIDEDDFREICILARMDENTRTPFGRIKQAIFHGTPLPKGHGDLIDRDALRESMNGACMGVMAGSDDYDAPLKTLDSATVVIGADRREK